ncbi:MAG: hypothetical protein ACOC1P_02915 [Minisyncoccales bacterium]
MIKQKKAAMEMSVGTIVTIVLLMSVLVLGLVLIRTIYTSSVENIKGIDQEVKGEIRKLFSEDDSRKVIVYPTTREITIKKGQDDAGFGFSIRNRGEEQEFSYEVEHMEDNCDISESRADELISLGREGSTTLGAGNMMDNPVFVRFDIPESAPPCDIRYEIVVTKGDETYSSPQVDVHIKPE